MVVTKEEIAAGYSAMPLLVPEDGGSSKQRSPPPPKKGKATGGSAHRTRSPTKGDSKSATAAGRGYHGGGGDDDEDDEKRRKKRKHAGERDAPADGEPAKRPPRKSNLLDPIFSSFVIQVHESGTLEIDPSVIIGQLMFQFYQM